MHGYNINIDTSGQACAAAGLLPNCLAGKYAPKLAQKTHLLNALRHVAAGPASDSIRPSWRVSVPNLKGADV